MPHIVSKNILPTISVALLMLALPIAAASSLHADLTADRIQSQGMIQGEAPLTALLHPHTSSTGASLSGFELAAEHVRVETDYAEISVVVAEASVNAKPMPETRVDHHAHASAWSMGVGSGFRFDVVPVEIGSVQATINASCAAAAPPAQDQYSRVVRVQSEGNRPDYTIDTSQSIQWETCDADATATMTGDFWFSAWAIDLKVEDANGTHSYWSGHRDDEVVTEDQELYVYVTNGTLQIPLGAGHGLFLESGGTTEVSGSVQLSNAHGRLTTPTSQAELGGDSVTLDGDMVLATQRGGDALEVALAGDADGAIIDGQAWQLTATPNHATSTGAWVWPLAVASFVVAFFAVRRWQSQRLGKQAMQEESSEARVELCDRALRLNARNGLALHLRALALHRQLRPVPALRDFDAAEKYLPRRHAELRRKNAATASHLAALVGRMDEAVAWHEKARSLSQTRPNTPEPPAEVA